MYQVFCSEREYVANDITVNMSGLNITTVNFVEVFDTEKRCLILGGFYPTYNYSMLNKCFYYIRCTFILALAGLEMLLLLINMYTQFPDLLKISENLLMFMTVIALVSKLINFIMQKNSVLSIEKQLRNSILTDIDEDEEKILNGYKKGVKLMALVFRLLCASVVLFYGLFPFLDQGSDEPRKLPLPIWVPFNTEDYYFYIWSATFLTLAIEGWISYNIDILPIMLIIIATVQFEILKKRFRNVGFSKNEKVSATIVKLRLIKCVVHFNKINSFINTVERTFSNGIFIQYLCSVLVICLTGFQMLVISFKKMQFVLLITYFNCMMCQIVIYCWYGHLLMESSDRISEACYSADWYKFDVKIQRMFMIILERSKYPVILKAGNFFPLNLQTFISILRSSYSYFAVLHNMYGDRMH